MYPANRGQGRLCVCMCMRVCEHACGRRKKGGREVLSGIGGSRLGIKGWGCMGGVEAAGFGGLGRMTDLPNSEQNDSVQ